MMLMYRQNYSKMTREKKNCVYDHGWEHQLEKNDIGIHCLI